MATIDEADPFLLHSSDQRNLVLVTQVLAGDNYPSWKRSMEMALNGKNKLGFIDGTIFPPEEVFSLIVQEEWQRGLTLAPPTSNETQLDFTVKNTHYNSKTRLGKKDKPFCAHCGLLGHTKDKC
ncbi:hypothetical protein HN51_021525 [Arachis hypogaea]